MIVPYFLLGTAYIHRGFVLPFHGCLNKALNNLSKNAF